MVSKEDVKIYGVKPVIYRIFHNDTNKSYIGKCSKGLSRIYQHFNDYHNINKEYRAKLLYRAMRKYGVGDFSWEILLICNSDEELDQSEIALITEFKTLDRKFGYNITPGGTGGNTWKNLTEEELVIAKERLSASGKKSYENSDTRRLAASERLKKTRSDPEKTKKNSEVCRERLKLLNKTDPRFINSRSISIVCLETGEEFSSIKEAAEKFDLWASILSIKMKQGKKYKGFTFVKK